MRDYERRAARESEVEGLFNLHREAFKDHIEQLWGSWDDQWQRDNFRRECAESSLEVVVSGEGLLGYLQHVDEPRGLRIWNIVICPQFRGQGIGSRIMGEFQQLARSRNVDLELRVFPTNLAALRFYERLGFRQVSRSATGIELAWHAT